MNHTLALLAALLLIPLAPLRAADATPPSMRGTLAPALHQRGQPPGDAQKNLRAAFFKAAVEKYF